jgi:flagellar assembly protein FliH
MNGVVKARQVRFDEQQAVPIEVLVQRGAPDLHAGSSGSPRLAPSIDECLARRQEEQRALEDRLERVQQALACLEQETKAREEQAYERGFEVGRDQGKALGLEERGERDQALRHGLAAAIGEFKTRLQALESLAIEVALYGLEKVLGDPAYASQWVTQTIVHHVGQMKESEVIAVEVSARDFPANEALAALAGEIDSLPVAAVRRSSALTAGQCVIRLDSGSLDASLASQLDRIREALAGIRI